MYRIKGEVYAPVPTCADFMAFRASTSTMIKANKIRPQMPVEVRTKAMQVTIAVLAREL